VQKLDRLHSIKHLTDAAVYGCHLHNWWLYDFYIAAPFNEKKNIYWTVSHE